MKFENQRTAVDSAVTLKRWLENRNAGKTFSEYFREYGYRTVGIFDAGEIGRLLYEELRDSDIQVMYFVDRNAEAIRNIDGIPVEPMYRVRDLPEADVAIISPVYDYESLTKMLTRLNTHIRTMYLKDAVYEM